MSRLNTITPEQATDKTAELFVGIKKAAGKVPNAYATIGTNSPDVLAQALQHNAVLKKGALSARELEAINLVVSETNGCDYCLAAHTLTSKMLGLNPEQIKKLRLGKYDEDTKLDALVRFARKLVSTRGTVPADDLEDFRAAGFSDRQVVETISAISAIYFTNLINRVNDTVLDFPRVS